LADFSNELFSLNGAIPDFLPARVRLSNGQTRYTTAITLEELNSCGYIGPINLPEHTSEERLVWSEDNLRFEVVTCTDLTCDQAHHDYVIRQSLRTILSNRDLSQREGLTDSGQAKLDSYYGNVLFLLSSPECLTHSDLPVLSLDVFDYVGSKGAYQGTYADWVDYIRYEYEVNGCYHKPEDYQDSVMSELYSSFVIPDSWVPSGTVI